VPEGRMLNLLPVPKKVIYGVGTLVLPNRITYQVEEAWRDKVGNFLSKLPQTQSAWLHSTAFLRCVPDTSLSTQGYRLTLDRSSVLLNYSSSQGLHYGLVTLKVLMHNYKNNIPCMTLRIHLILKSGRNAGYQQEQGANTGYADGYYPFSFRFEIQPP
jgi:hypothetical protein